MQFTKGFKLDAVRRLEQGVIDRGKRPARWKRTPMSCPALDQPCDQRTAAVWEGLRPVLDELPEGCSLLFVYDEARCGG